MSKLTRRAFIISGSVLGGGLLVGIGGLTYVNSKINQYSDKGFGEGTSLNAWIRIRPDNTITLAMPRAEMGQGVHTALAMLVAEELEVRMDQIELVHPQLASPYTNLALATGKRDVPSSWLNLKSKVAQMLPYVGTGGSTSVRDAYDHHRVLGASTREMLIQAAAQQWNVQAEDCYAQEGEVFHKQTQEKLGYGALAIAAEKLKPNKNPKLKKDPNIINQATQRLDVPAKVTGQADFGLDVRLENMLYAAMRHAPIVGGKIIGIQNKEQVLAMPGVKKIVELPDGLAVVANNTWRARQAAQVLELQVDPQGNENLSTESIQKDLDKAFEGPDTYEIEKSGDAQKAFSESSTQVEAEYEVPYLSHACMEPLNCTALVKDGKAEVWLGHQAPTLVVWGVNEATDISNDNITIHIKYLGGGFGRRAEKDFVVQAARVAKAMEGTPVQLVWSREEDIRNDCYRPLVKSRFKAALDEKGMPVSWINHMALQSVALQTFKRNAEFMSPAAQDDPSSPEGAIEMPYQFPNHEVKFSLIEKPVKVGFWRSVGHSQNAFFKESFLDELAHKGGKDPLQYRMDLVKPKSRDRQILHKLGEMSNWGPILEPGRGRGVALHTSFGSTVGQVFEISLNKDKELRVDKVYCVIDCGKTVQPDNIVNQMQGSIIFGLAAAFYGEITLKEGKIVQSNFPNYMMPKMAHSPQIEVHIMQNQEEPGGVGEPAVPPVLPALANAIFAASGERVRTMPLKNLGYTFV